MVSSFISLGLNCEPVSNLVQRKLVPTKAEGRQTMPFDLQLTTYTGLCLAVLEDFKNWFQLTTINNPKGEQYTNGTLMWCDYLNVPYHNGVIYNPMYGIVFNHESPGHPDLHKTEKWSSRHQYVADNYKLFKERYAARIDHFRTTIEAATKNNVEIVFYLNTDVTPIILVRIFKIRYPKLKFTFRCKRLNSKIARVLDGWDKYRETHYNMKPMSEMAYDDTYCGPHIEMDAW